MQDANSWLMMCKVCKASNMIKHHDSSHVYNLSSAHNATTDGADNRTRAPGNWHIVKRDPRRLFAAVGGIRKHIRMQSYSSITVTDLM